MQQERVLTERQVHRWYARNAKSERSGSTWLQDDGWGHAPPYLVSAETEEGPLVSGQYGRLERRLAYSVSALLDRELDSVPLRAEATIGLGASQQEALRLSLKDRAGLVIVTGGPGTGKTTMAQRVVSHFDPATVVGLSPTGKGADRLGESIGVECYTVHRAVWSGLDFSRASLIVIDEAGMLDVETAEMLFRFLHKLQCRILVLGDTGQLPSVGPGKVLDDLLSVVPSVRLLVTYRFSDADIGAACEAARVGSLHLANTDVYSLTEGGLDELWGEYVKLINTHGVYGVRVLTHRREDRDWFNRRCLERGISYKKEPIVCTRNSYAWQTFNGETGVIERGQLKFKRATIPPDKRHTIQWQYAFASTVHGAQGGQWPSVLVWSPWSRHITREWLLTGLSRAEKQLRLVVGDASKVETALHKAKPATRRETLLGAFIRGQAKWVY